MKRKHWLIIVACVCLVLAGICFLKVLPRPVDPALEQAGPNTTTSTTTRLTMPLKEDTHSSEQMPPQTGDETPDQTQGYTSPVDFEALWSINPDIYAWIDIPGTEISYPIVQSATDDSFYLDHDVYKDSHVNGSIFSEHAYNDILFEDAVTVLYGHNMKNGDMFGDLQPIYRDPENIDVYNEIVVYLPHKELHFDVFAALQYSRMHLLYYYQTEKKAAFDLFVDDVYSTRNLNTVLVDELRPEYGDQIVVLSTCLSGNNDYRYLVMGVCKEIS